MGKVFSAVADYVPTSMARTVSDSYNRRRGKKKKYPFENEESELYEDLHSPKRKKLLCTTHYIYQALFVEGKDSDITVDILGKQWKLHKIYLRQSQYFNSMFSGVWNETNKSHISIKAEDPNITIEALETVFSSFYLDEITVEPCMVVGVLAASTMFQLEGLIEQCCEIMLETISHITAVKYHQAACSYGSQNVKEKVIEWFLVNLTDYFVKNTARLREIDVDLMASLIGHPDLCVIQSEMTVYNLLRKWVYYRIHPTKDSNSENITEIENFFRNYPGNGPFLLTDIGLDYMRVFKRVRLPHLLLHSQDHSIVVQDKIIPETWLLTAYKQHWITLLGVAGTSDKGPETLLEDYFNENCLRCGRIINDGDYRSWRWNCFTFGVDLVWSIADNSIILGRQRLLFEYANRPVDHSLIIKVDVLNLDEKRQVKKRQKSEAKRLVLCRSQEVDIMTLDSDFEYPLYIFTKIQLTANPPSSGNKEPNKK